MSKSLVANLLSTSGIPVIKTCFNYLSSKHWRNAGFTSSSAKYSRLFTVFVTFPAFQHFRALFLVWEVLIHSNLILHSLIQMLINSLSFPTQCPTGIHWVVSVTLLLPIHVLWKHYIIYCCNYVAIPIFNVFLGAHRISVCTNVYPLHRKHKQKKTKKQQPELVILATTCTRENKLVAAHDGMCISSSQFVYTSDLNEHLWHLVLVKIYV